MLNLKKNKEGVLGGFLGMFIGTVLILIILVVFGLLSTSVRYFSKDTECFGDNVGVGGVCIDGSSEDQMVRYSYLFRELNNRIFKLKDVNESEMIILANAVTVGGNKKHYTYFKFLDGSWFWSCNLNKWYNVSMTTAGNIDGSFHYAGEHITRGSSYCKVINIPLSHILRDKELDDGIKEIKNFKDNFNGINYQWEVFLK